MANLSTPAGVIANVASPAGSGQPIVPKESLVKRVLPWISICGVAITLATFFLNANLRRRELTFTYLGADSLVHIEQKGLTSTLSIKYGDTPIHELYKLNFTIRNSGSAAIKAEDVKEALQINFPDGFDLIDTPAIEETRPQFTAHVEKVPSNSHVLLLTFPLLNPGDELKVSIDSLYLGKGSPTLSGRIVDVKQITNIDASVSRIDTRAVLPFIQNATLRHAVYWSLVVFNGLVGAFFVVLLGFQISRFLRHQIWHRNFAGRAKQNEPGLPPMPDSGLAGDWSGFFAMIGTFATLALFSFGNLAYIISGPSI